MKGSRFEKIDLRTTIIQALIMVRLFSLTEFGIFELHISLKSKFMSLLILLFVLSHKHRTKSQEDVEVQQITSVCPETRKMFCSPNRFLKEVTISSVKLSTRNIMLADAILENIMKYSMMHSSNQIIDALIEGTRLGLPSVKSYLES